MAQNHIRIADAYSSNKVAEVLDTTPSGHEYALAVRIIGGATIQGGGTSSMFTGTFPPSGTAAGFTDGLKMQGAMVYNTDTNVGETEYTLGVNLRGSGPGGSFELGTLSHPIFVNLSDPGSGGFGTQDNPIYVEDAAYNTYQHINSPNTTIVLSSAPGVLVSILVTNFGAPGATTTIYDNTSASGTIIANINTSAVIGELAFDINYDIGLTVVTDSRSPGDITIIYK